MQYCSNILSSIQSILNGTDFPSIEYSHTCLRCAGFNPGPHTLHLVSISLSSPLICNNLSAFHCGFFFFMVTLTFLKCVCLFYRMLLILGVSECLLWLGYDYAFLAEIWQQCYISFQRITARIIWCGSFHLGWC